MSGPESPVRARSGTGSGSGSPSAPRRSQEGKDPKNKGKVKGLLSPLSGTRPGSSSSARPESSIAGMSSLSSGKSASEPDRRQSFSAIFLQDLGAGVPERPLDYEVDAMKKQMEEFDFVECRSFSERYAPLVPKKKKPVEKKEEKKALYEIPVDSLMMRLIDRTFRTAECTVPKALLEQNNSPHVKSCLELFSREQWVLFNGKYQGICSSLNSKKHPVPKWDPDVCTSHEVQHKGGIDLPFMKNVSDEDQAKMRKEWHAELAKRQHVFSSFPQEPVPPCMFDVNVLEPFPDEKPVNVLVECMGLRFNFGDLLEPMFCSMYLVDMSTKRKVSEVWRFHVTPESLLVLLPNLENLSPLARSQSALFSLPPNSKPNSFFVFQLQKVLAGVEVNTAAEPYMKEALKPKEKEKIQQEVQNRCRFLGDFTQMLAYSFLPLVEAEDEAPTTSRKFQLLKWRSEMSEKSILESIEQTYYQKGKRIYLKNDPAEKTGRTGGVFGNLFGKNIIPSSLDFRISLPESHPAGCVSPTLIPVRPVSKDPFEAIREIQPFLDASEQCTPAMDYVNTLYFYPETLNFNRHPSNSSRNIALKIKLMESAKDAKADGLPFIYSPMKGGEMVSEQWTTVTYHNTRPVFCNEEVKILLPASLKKGLHIVVQFYHVKCNLAGKKKTAVKPEEMLQELGFAVVPIVDSNANLLEDQEETIPVMLNYFDNYLSQQDEGVVQYVDQGKKIFQYRTFAVSTVHCQQENIRNFFRSIILGTEGGGAHLKKSIRNLRHAPAHLLERFFPVLGHHLIRVVCEEKEEYACLAVIALGWILELISQMRNVSNASRLAVANAFVLHLINQSDVKTPPPAASVTGGEEEPEYVKGLHFKLVRTWLSLIHKCQTGDDDNAVSADLAVLAGATRGQAKSDVEQQDDPMAGLKDDILLVLHHSWFFLALIFKSQCLYIPAGVACPLSERFCPEYVGALGDLILNLAALANPHLNLCVSRFLRDCLRLMEHGQVLELMTKYVLSIDNQYKSEGLVAYKFLALETFLDFEHSIPLSTPAMCPSWTNSSSPAVSSLVRDFWRQHPLVGLFLYEVRCCLQSPIEKIRMCASRSLFDVLWRLDHDARYESPFGMEAIANMFFPFLLILMEFWEQTNSEMSQQERSNWMMSLLFVLRHCSKDGLLRLWWLNDTQVGRVTFLDLLYDLVREFEDPSLGVETSFVVLAILEDFMGDFEKSMTQEDSVFLRGCLRVLDAILGRKQSTDLISNTFLSLRWFLWRFQQPLFNFKDTSYCGTLAYHILRYSNVAHGPVRMQAAALFALMLKLNYSCRSNIARMRLQSTIAISRLAEDNTPSYDNLREVLTFVGALLQEEGPKELGELYTGLHTTLKKVIHDSERIAEYRFDPEMTEELFFDVSIAYRDSPDLRVTWLENLAKHHTDRKNYDEAAQSRILMAALVVQRLMELPDYPERGLPTDPIDFLAVSPVVGKQPGLPKITSAQAAEEGIYQSELFSEQGLTRTLKEAIRLFACGGSFELGVILNEVVFVQHYSHLRHYQALSNTFRQMETFAKQLAMSEDARFFGYYYRVFFVGKNWGDLADKEFIYKEQNDVSFVNTIKERLEQQFKSKYGTATIKLLKNSMLLHTPELREKEYAAGNLDPEVMYWQLVSVKEYFSDEEAKHRNSQWERRFNISRFIYETPFTKDQDSDQTESVEHQWKRKQVISVERPFPSPKKRQLVVGREIIEVTPIENAIELLDEKISFLRGLMSERDPASKLQFFHRELQGAVLPMVNAGPLAIAKTFLGDYEKYDPEHVCQLRDTVLDFSKVLYFALKIYQRCEAEKKEKERKEREDAGEVEAPAQEGALDFSTVVAEEYEKFKKDVESLVKNSAPAEKGEGGSSEGGKSESEAPSKGWVPADKTKRSSSMRGDDDDDDDDKKERKSFDESSEGKKKRREKREKEKEKEKE